MLSLARPSALVAALLLSPAALADCPELLTNGDFETGSPAPWMLVGEDFNFSDVVEDDFTPLNEFFVFGYQRASSGAGDVWEAGLEQAVSVTAGATYRLSFWARGDDSSDLISPGYATIAEAGNPSEHYGLYQPFDWLAEQQYSFEFTATETADGVFTLFFGSDDIIITIDSIFLEEISSADCEGSGGAGGSGGTAGGSGGDGAGGATGGSESTGGNGGATGGSDSTGGSESAGGSESSSGSGGAAGGSDGTGGGGGTDGGDGGTDASGGSADACGEADDGNEGCACYGNDTCNGDLVCSAGTCEESEAGEDGSSETGGGCSHDPAAPASGGRVSLLALMALAWLRRPRLQRSFAARASSSAKGARSR